MANLYVDKTHGSASDSTTKASNSESNPWLTIARAARGAPSASAVNTSQAAAAGDTVFVKGNGQTYTELTPASTVWNTPALRPANSGTSGSPILFRPYPGHSVTIRSNSASAIIGTSGGKNYIIWEGFNVVQNNLNSSNACIGAALTNTVGSEIGYCTISTSVAPVNNTGTIHSGIVVNLAQNSRIHHCNIFGFKGNSNNQPAIISWQYGTAGMVIEDNYLHDCACGFYPKAGDFQTHCRRNFITAVSIGIDGNNPTQPLQTVYFYDNVCDGSVKLHRKNSDSEYHDNLIRAQQAAGTISTVADTVDDFHFWNNVVQHSTPQAWRQHWTRTGNEWTFFDYNIYTGTPDYLFGSGGSTDLTMAQIQELGFETHSQANVTFSNIYDAAWNLKAAYQSAGRGGSFRDTVGPATDAGQSIVASILNTSRYGSGAYTGAPAGNNPPNAVLVITNISSLTVDTDNTGSSDTDGTIASRSTNWGDGSAASTTSAPSHTYASGGTYTITLTVTDDDGATDQDTEQIQIGSVAPLHVSLAKVRPSTRRRTVRI